MTAHRDDVSVTQAGLKFLRERRFGMNTNRITLSIEALPLHPRQTMAVDSAPLHRRGKVLSEEKKREILAVIRGGSGMTQHARHFRERLDDLAAHIPDFGDFSKMVTEDLRETHHHDRMHKVRTLNNRIQVWKRLYGCWARRNGVQSGVRIRARDYEGSYECSMERRAGPDVWEQFIDIGIIAGVPLASLNALYHKHKDAPATTVRAGGKLSARPAPAAGTARNQAPAGQKPLAYQTRQR